MPCKPINVFNQTIYAFYVEPPKITWISSTQHIHEHTPATLLCNVTGSEPMEVEWRKLGSAAVLGLETNFTIAKILRSQEGTYEVTASNGHECPITSSSTYIDVLCKLKHYSLFFTLK